jgi:glycosyltransferase involved in cell wall biosynthesis
MIIGVDASNIRQGGGKTHLVELISVLEPNAQKFDKLIVWCNQDISKNFINKPWLIIKTPKDLDLGPTSRFIWQRFKLSRLAKVNCCDLLLIPGGSFSGKFKPFVTMSRNMLPFEWTEAKRYGVAIITLRLIILRFLQSKTFKNANGVIFLTNYAKEKVLKVSGNLPCKKTIIPHGLNSRFKIIPKEQHLISEYSNENPFQLLYISIIDQYKHQWHVVEAVSKLKLIGYPIVLNLVGPSYPKALKRLDRQIKKFDINNEFIKYHGPIPYDELREFYEKSHLGIFASSCENMPNILLETMAAGLPIACSNRGPMPEVLGDAGLFFNPESPKEISVAIESLINNPKLRKEKSFASFQKAQKYSWQECADDTFDFLREVLSEYEGLPCAE